MARIAASRGAAGSARETFRGRTRDGRAPRQAGGGRSRTVARGCYRAAPGRAPVGGGGGGGDGSSSAGCRGRLRGAA